MNEKKKKPRTLNSPQQFMLYALKEAIFHPRKRISYLYPEKKKWLVSATETSHFRCFAQGLFFLAWVNHLYRIRSAEPPAVGKLTTDCQGNVSCPAR